jgi:hypothetical protein
MYQSRMSRRHQFGRMQIERTFAAVSADKVSERPLPLAVPFGLSIGRRNAPAFTLKTKITRMLMCAA